MCSTKPPKKDYNRDEARIHNARKFTEISRKEFLKNHPNLNYTNVQPKHPQGAFNQANLQNKQMAQIEIPAVPLSVLCGTVFGDGNLAIQNSYVNARLQYRHSTRQTEWCMWKTMGPLKSFMTDNSIKFQMADGKQENAKRLPGELLGKWQVISKAEPNLTKVHTILCPKGKKEFARSWLNHMNEWFLLTIWLDDGSLNSGDQGMISTNSFTLEGAKVFADYLETVWDVKCHVSNHPSRQTSTNQDAPTVHFKDLDNLEKFLEYIVPILPVKSMLYKVCILAEDDARRQRWASMLKSHLSHWEDDIDKIYAYYEVHKTKK